MQLGPQQDHFSKAAGNVAVVPAGPVPRMVLLMSARGDKGQEIGAQAAQREQVFGQYNYLFLYQPQAFELGGEGARASAYNPRGAPAE